MRESEHLNTPRLVADDTQKTVWKWEQQEPFGAGACNPDPDGDNVQFEFNLRFPGQYFDRETNLHYNDLRDFDPQVGRYLEPDLWGVVIGWPVADRNGLNHSYSYAHNRTLQNIDPTGEVGLVAGAAIAGAITGAVSGFSGSVAGSQGNASVGQMVVATVGGAIAGASIGTAAAVLAPVAIEAGLGLMVANALTGAAVNLAAQLQNLGAPCFELNYGSTFTSAVGGAAGRGVTMAFGAVTGASSILGRIANGLPAMGVQVGLAGLQGQADEAKRQRLGGCKCQNQ